MSSRLESQPNSPQQLGKATTGEILAWAMYDVANSTYATVIATAIYNAYFVNVIVGGPDHSRGTLLLTIVICIAASLIVLSAPVLGTIADATASKKKLLFISTWICIVATTSLTFCGPGQYVPAMILLVLANFAFGTGEDFIASFLPEISTKQEMGRVSAFGWAAGYIGGLLSLGASLLYVSSMQTKHLPPTHFVPNIVLGCAAFYGLASIPTFLFLKERAQPDPQIRPKDYVRIGFDRLRMTFSHARHYRDLFNLLLTICIYSCGSGIIVHLASVYAQNSLHFTTKESLLLILVVDITAAIGATIFGFVQDKIGSVKTLAIVLIIWAVAIVLAFFAQTKMDLWVAGNVVGLAMGASGSAGRTLVGQFSPPGRSGEFLGLWGVAVKLATAIGALSFGLITHFFNIRMAMLSTVGFFLIGLLMLLTVNEQRGIRAAHEDVAIENP